jgi:mRNA interferase MazF
MNIERGGVYLAALDPVVGKEIAKTRPVVVVSNDVSNKFSGTVTILPITSGSLEKIHPYEVFLGRATGGLPKDSKVKANQIRTLDKSRLIKFLGDVGEEYMRAIEEAVKIHLDLT